MEKLEVGLRKTNKFGESVIIKELHNDNTITVVDDSGISYRYNRSTIYKSDFSLYKRYDTSCMKKIPNSEYYADENGYIYNKRGRRLRTHFAGLYLVVCIKIDGKIKTRTVHRLVCSAYHPNPNNLPQVNHKNGIKTDNRPCNLEWVTESQNRKHSFDVLGQTTNGEKNSQAKLKSSDVLEIREYASNGVRGCVLAEKYGVSAATICDIVSRRSWKHI